MNGRRTDNQVLLSLLPAFCGGVLVWAGVVVVAILLMALVLTPWARAYPIFLRLCEAR